MSERSTPGFDGSPSLKRRKPNHVRRLNFGQSILTLDTVQQFPWQKDGSLIIDRNAAGIPCTEKNELVRFWVQTHYFPPAASVESPQTSPVLGSFATKALETSPIFGNNRKRTRGKNRSKNSDIEGDEYARFNGAKNQIDRVLVGASNENQIDMNCFAIVKKENIKRKLFNPECDVFPSQVSHPCASPILDKNYSFKRRRTKLQEDKIERKALNRIENTVTITSTSPSCPSKTLDSITVSPILNRNSYIYKHKRRKTIENNYVDTNMNSVKSCNVDHSAQSQNKNKLMSSQARCMLLKKLETLEIDNLDSSTAKDSKILENSISSDSPVSKVQLNIDDSPKDTKDSAKMEIECSNEDSNSHKDTVNINSDTDKDLSDHIEDVDVHDVTSTIKNNSSTFKHCAVLASKSASICSNNDSDETYCSNAEVLLYPSSSQHISQNISQISSQITSTNNKSSQSAIYISTETSPPRNSEPFVPLCILDSVKKKKKPKRGSLSERLQCAIKSQISSVRIWRHQLKQTMKRSSSTPCVTVFVRKCTVHFGRQFLEGIIVEDSSELLLRKSECNSSRAIKIMTIPEIVGKVEIASENLVQIFPPWQVLDDKELTLNVTFLKIIFKTEHIDIKVENNEDRVKRQIFKEFDCLCIKAGKMSPFCQERLNKPNIMEQLFDQK